MIIPIECIHPNPLNPRKDLGDLSELTSSIKKNGIFQNLVVLENEASGRDYTLIMGHRRYAAAVKAGLKEIPCNVVRNISEADQVTMMLSENMQRNNLTKFEETAGIQQALDLGMSESEVAEKTGFSKATINKHKKAMQAGEEVVQKAYAKGATLDQLIELSKIEDEKMREKVSEYLGSYQFDYQLEEALEKQEWQPKKEAIIAMLKEKLNAKPGKRRWGEGKQIKTIDDELPKSKGKYFYYAGELNVVWLYHGEEKTDSNASSKKSKTDVAKEERREQRNKAFKIAWECRLKFYQSLLDQKKLKLPDEFKIRFMRLLCSGDIYRLETEITEIVIGSEREAENFVETCDSLDKLILMCFVSAMDEGEEDRIATTWEGEYKFHADDSDRILYEEIQKLGYHPSDVEESMMDGSWELFEK